MPRCIHCGEDYLDSLRRCPHCGESQDEASLARATVDAEEAPALSLGHVARRRRKRTIVVLIVLGAIGIGTVVAIPFGETGGKSVTANDIPVLRTQPNWAKLEAPADIETEKAATSFAIESARVVGDGVLVIGTCSPLGAAEVTVDGHPAVRSPYGDRFHAFVPLDDGRVEVVARNVDGDEARLERDVSAAGVAVPEAPAVRLTSHVDGGTVTDARVSLRIHADDGRDSLVREDDVELTDVENVVEVNGRAFRLYRAPKGVVFLRTTGTGHHAFLREADGSEMVLVPGGVAKRGMGEAPPHGPAHMAQLRPFLIDRTEVTCRQYAAFLSYARRTNDASLRHSDDPGRSLRPLGWTNDEPPRGHAALPVTGVSWYGAFSYARWVGGRLPTEAEWERAAAGAVGRVYPWGNEFDAPRCAWQTGGPVPADSVPGGEGPCSLLHMSGNVREWCDDRFDPRWYKRGSRTNPRGPSHGLHRVVRGGSYASSFDALRLQHRDQLEPSKGYPDVGFRVARPWTIAPRRDGK